MNLFSKRVKQPNVIFILVDQFRYDRLNCHPIFSELQKMGTLFTEMITYAPYTIASMPAILTGMYGTENGVDAYYKALDFKKDECHTLTEYLQDNGYYTLADTFRDVLVPKPGFENFLLHDENNVDIIKRHIQIVRNAISQERKFFLFLHYGMIHKAMVEHVFDKYDDFDEDYFGNIAENSKRYDTFAIEAGHYLECVFGLFNELNLYNNTLIVVCTDHGCGVGERPGEKAYGSFLYEYTLRTWAYYIFPKLLPQNKTITNLVRTIDNAPTILEILGIKQKSRYKNMQGESLLSLMLEKQNGDRIAYAETGGLGGPYPSTHEPNVKCVRTKEWKLIYNKTTKEKELYNLTNDSSESINLIGQFPEIENGLWGKMTEISRTAN